MTVSRWRMLALLLACLCGFVVVAAAVTSNGSDLRPAGGDLNSVLRDRAREVETRREEAARLQREVDALSRKVDDADLRRDLRRVAALSDPAGLTPVQGPGLRIALQDAPRSVDIPGLDPNLLVVHQQDIQAFVNALWAGGAEAVTLQGQRLITSIGIKCVGNTVVLDGVPYAPPYVIEAIGNQGALRQALAASPEVATYTQYAERYRLGLDERAVDRIKAPAYDGSVSMRYATALE
ncbi:DUF881 domain-containing protein [Aeromicrobium duanguangcaii]|uniref:DUF881 domain-containing protein n=1 Tax=Aeromicrobium duanguangcaii TaxID=2968086 RepID=A0ABY5KHS0_9ACTN|nr:DUF881 domain-containing protein [Aeromicrobium duanguangcaii]MCD9154348.1 DUF881 domain-containing protein [Aeromicrobium duanguangcaii]MCL3838094.1 DUF881 domain-containing protein [Aeromicrobium duanguangcaii]UUI68586.1 DUF881 domain-containing protein [Aeromicrobium duanguangcaii]